MRIYIREAKELGLERFDQVQIRAKDTQRLAFAYDVKRGINCKFHTTRDAEYLSSLQYVFVTFAANMVEWLNRIWAETVEKRAVRVDPFALRILPGSLSDHW